jgi:CubicO group peptidase (beta-lactamase class C family)
MPRAYLLASLVSLVACVSPPKNTPPANHAAGGPFVGDAALAPTRVANPPQPAPSFDDPGRKARAVRVLPDIDAMARSVMTKENMPGLAIGVVLDGELIFAKGYGGVGSGGFDGDTVFRIGSITKVFTGVALLKLRDEGRLSLDHPAARYVPELGGLVYPTADAAPITISQLITHTAGVSRNSIVDHTTKTTPSDDKTLKSLDGLRLSTPPGITSQYSNAGVGYLSLIIGKAAGRRYRDYVSQTILTPLGMTTSHWDAEDVPAGKLAQAHDKAGQPIAAADHWHMGASESAGGLYSSVNDIARFVGFQLAAWPPRSDRDSSVLRRSSVRESQQMRVSTGLKARIAQREGKPELRARAKGVGIGWQVEQTCSHDHLVWHNGGTEGYRSAVFMLPRRGIGVIALTNSKTSTDGVAIKALNMLVKDAALKPRKPQPSKAVAEALGVVSSMMERGNINEPDYIELFTPRMRANVPLTSMRELATSSRSKHGACKMAGYVRVSAPNQVVADFKCDDGFHFDVSLALDAGTPQRVSGLRVDPHKKTGRPAAASRCQ